VQAFFLIHLLFLLAIQLSEELLKLDKLISSLSSGDEKIFNSDGTKIEIDEQNTAAPSSILLISILSTACQLLG
jgi:hypothetical protein